MAIFDDNKGLCPNCGNYSGFRELYWLRVWPDLMTQASRDHTNPATWVMIRVLECQYCTKTVTLREQWADIPADKQDQQGVTVIEKMMIHRTLVHPAPSPRELDATVPAPIRSLYREASECENVGAFRGAGVLYRAAVEELVKDQGGTGRVLYDRIESLRTIEGFPDQLVDEFLHEARKLGNDSIHDGLVYGADEVADVADLIEEAVVTLYVQPAERQRMREARQARREAK